MYSMGMGMGKAGVGVVTAGTRVEKRSQGWQCGNKEDILELLTQ